MLIILSSICYNAAFSQSDLTRKEAELFGPGIFSTGLNERDMAISPDGKEYYYTIIAPRNAYSVILVRKLINGKWSEAAVAPFSGVSPDLEPAFSPDGKKLFFVSSRPLTGEGPDKDFNIWYMERTSAGWSIPKQVGSNINTEGDEYYPSVTNDGTLYFTANYDNSTVKDEIFKSKLINGEYQKPENLGEPINSKGYEFNAYIDPEEKFLIYTCYGREDDMGHGDLYISYRKENGEWQQPKNLGAAINSANGLDYCPYISPDKKYFYFTSERVKENKRLKPRSYKEVINNINNAGNALGDIYRIDLNQVLK
ncbi:MAG TPA: hypothetical protein PLP23_21730 [Panacibacter sp.]|nr:hypothetical protein [Panacibacter sp.]